MEKVLQTRIMNDLKKAGWEVFKMPPIVRGFPDVMAFKKGQTIFIEVKDGDKGRLGLAQAKMIKRLREQGFIAVIIKTKEEWLEFLGGLL